MITRQLFIITTVISLAGHIIIIGLMGLMNIGNTIDTDTLFTIDLQEQTDLLKSPDQRKPFPAPPADKVIDVTERKNEDTVDLDNRDTPYQKYLITVKQMIRDRWSYPGSARERRDEGTTVVRFSIREDGRLVDSRVIVSSGHESLDRESFHAVSTASPFEPLPKEFNLTQLHIVARFQYVLGG